MSSSATCLMSISATLPTWLMPATRTDSVAAKISRTAGALDPKTRTLYIEIDVENGDNFLVPGAFAYVTLHLPVRSYPQLPVAALIIRGGKSYVASVTDDGKVKLRGITVAATDGSNFTAAERRRGWRSCRDQPAQRDRRRRPGAARERQLTCIGTAGWAKDSGIDPATRTALAKEDLIEFDGVVTELLPDARFRVKSRQRPRDLGLHLRQNEEEPDSHPRRRPRHGRDDALRSHQGSDQFPP